MKKLVRVTPILVLIVVLALVPALTAFAQGGGANPLCAGLSDSDCKILTDSQASLQGVTSLSTPAFSISLNMTTATDSIAFSAKGSGAFAVASQTDFTIHLMIDEVSATSNGQTESLSAMEVILTPAKAFVNYNGEWYGQDLTADDIESLGLGSLSSLGDMTGGQGGMGDLSSLGIDLTGVLTTARGADNEVGGTQVAVFTTSLDLPKLITAVLSSPAIGQALGMVGGETGTTMTPADLQMMTALVQPMIAGTTLSLEQWISQDGVIRGIKLDVVINIDASMFSPETGKIAGEFHFMTELADLNQPVEVTPPASYKPMDDLQPQLDALQSGLGM